MDNITRLVVTKGNKQVKFEVHKRSLSMLLQDFMTPIGLAGMRIKVGPDDIKNLCKFLDDNFN